MKEQIDETFFDDETFAPVEITVSDVVEEGVSNKFYGVNLEAELGEAYVDFFQRNDMEADGFGIEDVMHTYLKDVHPTWMKDIEFDSDDLTFMAWTEKEEVQHKVATLVAKLFTDFEYFKEEMEKVDLV
jgi:hypothetical protein